MIKLLLVDCDGVLTDGMYNTSEEGSIFKTFFSRDFHGMWMLDKQGVEIAVITTASDLVIEHQCGRAALYMRICSGVKDKAKFVAEDRAFQKYDWSEMAFMGDDTFDIPLLKRVGLPACPIDAAEEVLDCIGEADDGYQSDFSGGRAAVRQFADYSSEGENR